MVGFGARLQLLVEGHIGKEELGGVTLAYTRDSKGCTLIPFTTTTDCTLNGYLSCLNEENRGNHRPLQSAS